MTVCAFDHPLLSALLGDEELAASFALRSELQAMLDFEVGLTRALAAEELVPPTAAEAIAALCRDFAPDLNALRQATARDGVVVPELVRQLRERLSAEHRPHLHFGATSQDVVDTALILRLRQVVDVLEGRLRRLVVALGELRDRFGANALTARTRMQNALPITAADRIEAWTRPLQGHAERLAELKPGLLVVQFGGPVGTLGQLGARGAAVRARLAAELELADRPQWQTDRTAIAGFGSWLSLLAGSLGKIGADVALMHQDTVREVQLTGTGGSSSMPHKSNPVAAETLLALARFAATLLPGLHHALVHEQERSGAAWTLEWLVLPQLVLATGASLRTAARLVGEIGSLGDPGATEAADG